MAGGVIFKIVFLLDIFYVPMQEVFNLTHTQMGGLVTAFAVTQLLSYLPGGWITDMVPTKILIPFGLILTSLCGFWMAIFPSYNQMLLIQAIQGFTITLLFWQAMIKGVRLLGSSNQQGRLFGILEGGRGLVGAIVNLIALQIFARFGSSHIGLRGTILFYSTFMLILGILCFFLIKKDEVEGNVKPKKALKGMFHVAKMPRVWVAGLVIFFGYSFYCGLSYFSIYSTEILGMSVELSVLVNIIRQNIIAILAAPLAGIVADRMNSSIKFLKIIFIMGALFTVLFITMPENANVYLIVILMLLLAVVVFSLRGTYYSTTDEIKVPIELAGSCAGILSLLGNTDIFIYTVYGYILDSFPGRLGFQLLFLLMAFFAIAGLICAISLDRMKNNINETKEEEIRQDLLTENI